MNSLLALNIALWVAMLAAVLTLASGYRSARHDAKVAREEMLEARARAAEANERLRRIQTVPAAEGRSAGGIDHNRRADRLRKDSPRPSPAQRAGVRRRDDDTSSAADGFDPTLGLVAGTVFSTDDTSSRHHAPAPDPSPSYSPPSDPSPSYSPPSDSSGGYSGGGDSSGGGW